MGYDAPTSTKVVGVLTPPLGEEPPWTPGDRKNQGSLDTKSENYTLPETNMAPENHWLVQMNFLLGPGLF